MNYKPLLLLMCGASLLQTIQSCASGPPTRTQVEAAEDKFCEGIARIRAAEKALKTEDSEAGGPQ